MLEEWHNYHNMLELTDKELKDIIVGKTDLYEIHPVDSQKAIAALYVLFMRYHSLGEKVRNDE